MFALYAELFWNHSGAGLIKVSTRNVYNNAYKMIHLRILWDRWLPSCSCSSTHNSYSAVITFIGLLLQRAIRPNTFKILQMNTNALNFKLIYFCVFSSCLFLCDVRINVFLKFKRHDIYRRYVGVRFEFFANGYFTNIVIVIVIFSISLTDFTNVFFLLFVTSHTP